MIRQSGSVLDKSRAAPRKLDVDFSLSLLNRTGAYYISKDLIENLRPLVSSVRCWRLPPNVTLGEGVLRKLAGRAMLIEYRALRETGLLRISRPAQKTLYLDPLYVLRTELSATDIVLCHDVGPLTHSDLFDERTVAHYREAYAKIQRVGPGVVFVSDASKREFVRLFGERFRFLRVITLYPRRTVQLTAPRAVPGIDKPFVLAVGALEHRKNYARCIEAFARSGLCASYQFVICGPRGNATAAMREAAARHTWLKVLGAVSDAELRWLYQQAKGFLLPSLLEGFGVPVIEAAERGLLCVASAGSAQEEALGGHGIFVDPTDTGSIAAGLEQLVSMRQEAREGLIEAARAHTSTLTMERFVNAWKDLLLQEHAALQPRVVASREARFVSASRRS